MDISGVKIQVVAVYQHSWAAGRTLSHVVPTYPHAQFQHHLWLVENGVVEFETDDHHYKVSRNEACLLPFILKRHVFTREPTVWMSLHIIITVYNNFDLMRNLSLPAHWKRQPRRLYRKSAPGTAAPLPRSAAGVHQRVLRP